MGSRKAYGRLIGALFLAGILVYAVGFQLVSSITSEPDFVSTISVQQTVLVLGAFLMLLNTVVDLGKGVLFFPILENHGKRTALGLPGRADCPSGPAGHRGALSSDACSLGPDRC